MIACGWLVVCLTGLSAGAAAMYGLPGGSTPSPYGLPPSPHSAAAVAAAAAAAAQLANSFYAPPHPPAPADLAHHMSWSVRRVLTSQLDSSRYVCRMYTHEAV